MWLVGPVLDNIDLEAEMNNARQSKQLSKREKHKNLGNTRKGEADDAWEKKRNGDIWSDLKG